MKSRELFNEVFNLLFDYESQSEQAGMSPNLSDFIGYLNSNSITKGIKAETLSGGEEEYEGGMATLKDRETDISILIVLMYRYAKSYLKKAFSDSIIRTADEFSILITLLTHESMVKTELIQSQVMEKTSGMEIIKRLIRLGLIESFADEIDKRSTRVKITHEGRMELGKLFPKMQMVSQIVPGDLNTSERNQLAYLLRRLDHFHHQNFMENKNETLEKLMHE